MTTVAHLTTVHPRSDTRIYVKEAGTLAACTKQRVVVIVADGKGNVDAGPGLAAIFDLGVLSGGRLGRVLVGSWRALRAVVRLKPMLVHFHDPELIPLGVLLRIMGYKVIYDVHEDVPRQVFSKYYIPVLMRYPIAVAIALLEWICAPIWSAILPATPIIAGTPIIAARFPKSKTVVVHNYPIDSELALPNATPYLQRCRSFTYLGGIEKVRGAFEMVSAMEYLKDFPDARLDLAGWFSPPVIEGELRLLPGWLKVNFHGEVDRPGVARILSAALAGMVVLHPEPTHVESYPIKMFEYMSAGIPVIASDFPVWRRVIDQDGCGLLVNPLDPASIGEAMRWVVEHPKEAQAMGMRGREAVERSYNWNTEAVRLVNLYRRLLGA